MPSTLHAHEVSASFRNQSTVCSAGVRSLPGRVPPRSSRNGHPSMFRRMCGIGSPLLPPCIMRWAVVKDDVPSATIDSATLTYSRTPQCGGCSGRWPGQACSGSRPSVRSSPTCWQHMSQTPKTRFRGWVHAHCRSNPLVSLLHSALPPHPQMNTFYCAAVCCAPSEHPRAQATTPKCSVVETD